MEQTVPMIIGALIFASGCIIGSALTQSGRKGDKNE